MTSGPATRSVGLNRHSPLTGEKVKAYAEAYLTPANVGARKGIFVPRELVNKLSKLIALYDVEGLTIGAYVTNILVNHLVDNRDAINELSFEGEKTVSL